MARDESEAPRRELRLALVLYGGVSLCIYMHGTTKEIHRLVAASAALAAGVDAEQTPSERVYRELLGWLAGRDEVRTDVSVDVVAGTSAGGINGVYLAKALARNLSQDMLRDLWLDRGDLGGLLLGPRLIPWRARLPAALLLLAFRPALHGERMAVWLYEALAEMDGAGRQAGLSTLMPQGASLDLMVTMTDHYGYDRQVAIADPKIVHDEQHRHVVRLSQSEDPDRYGPGDNLVLAFAARATSCFPGAFEPVSPRAFCAWVSQPGPIGEEFFRIYELSGADAGDTLFVDGGVLDNRPFAPAIEALRRKPAESEVERWVLYLDPDPAGPFRPRSGPLLPPAAIVGAIAGLPRKQPILDSLLEIGRMNDHVREVRDVIEASFEDVRRLVGEIAGEVLAGAHDGPRLREADHGLVQAARSQLGLGYAPYLRARVAGLIDGLASAVCEACRFPPESNHAMLTRRIWRAWARARGLFADARASAAAQQELLDGLDVNYAVRRVRFTLAGVNWLYERAADDGAARERAPRPRERAVLDAAKARLWQGIAGLEAALDGALDRHADAVATCFPQDGLGAHLAEHGLDPGPWLAGREPQLSRLVSELASELGPRVRDSGPELYTELLALADRPDLRVRYVGFPLFDAQLYPLEYAAGVGERDRIDVMRLSPADCELLAWPAEPKVKGRKLGHFGAFTKRAWRENDYLAGRLDGAERMIGLLVGDADERERRRWSAMAFRAILEEERSALRGSGELIDTLLEQIGTL